MTYKQDSIWPISPPFKFSIILGPKVRIMKFLIVAVCVAAALAANPDLDQEWQMWKDKNQKKYKPEEEDYRRFVWEYNYKVVTEHNNRYALGHTSYTMAMNQFADMVRSSET